VVDTTIFLDFQLLFDGVIIVVEWTMCRLLLLALLSSLEEHCARFNKKQSIPPPKNRIDQQMLYDPR
jgi:hypothetical protein